MAAIHTVVDAPELRCVSHELHGIEPLPDAPPLRPVVAEMERKHAAIVDGPRGVVLHLEPLVAVFDARWDALTTIVGLPLKDDVAPADELTCMTWESARVLELRYGESRPFPQILEDVYRQATGFSTASKLRDLGNFIRITDFRRAKANGGWLVQVETVLRLPS